MAAGAIFFLVSACGTAPTATGINDPYEAANRSHYETLVAVDRAIIRPVSNAYGTVLPERARTGVNNFATNFGLPGAVVNNILQGDIEGGGQNAFRFVVNTLFGFGGFLDPASDMGLYRDRADFGQTLNVWGVGEGVYRIIPLVGPSTSRDYAGFVVDLFTNPLSYILTPPESYASPVSKVASKLGDRYRFSGTVDSIFYESADGYAQARLLYLQNRRFELETEEKNDYADPYEDPYAQ